MRKPANSWFLYRLFPTTYLSIFLLVFLFPAGFCLPAWWGGENGPLEDLQILLLIVGLAVSWLVAWNKSADRDQQARNFWLGLAPYWLLCILRELSWGRVFYPVSMGVNGPEFITLEQLPYGFLVKPFIAIVIIITFVVIYCTDPVPYIRQTKLPFYDVFTLFLAALIALFCDKNLFPSLNPYRQVLEEWAELTIYWSMVSIAVVTGFTKSASLSVKQVKKRPIIRHL